MEQVKRHKAGRTIITVQEAMDLKQAVIIINVKERPTQRLLASQKNLAVQKDVDSASNEKIESIQVFLF